jgi:hypothetical protein
MFPVEALCLAGFRGAEGEKPGSQSAELMDAFCARVNLIEVGSSALGGQMLTSALEPSLSLL